MQARLLFKVEDVVAIKGRGLVLVPDVPVDALTQPHPHTEVFMLQRQTVITFIGWMIIILLSIALIAAVEVKPLRSVPLIVTSALSLFGAIAASVQLWKEFKRLGWQITHQHRELILFDLVLIALLCINVVFFLRL